MPKESESQPINQKAFTKKANSKRQTRYFHSKIDNVKVEKVKLKCKKQQKFEGEVIEVDQKRVKAFKKHFKAKNRLDQIVRKEIIKKVKKEKIPKALLEKYTRGESVETSGVKTKFFKEKQQRKEIYLEYATEQAARTELLFKEEQGFIEPDEEEITVQYRQGEIAKNVDILAASKHFKLNLDLGPYHMRYTNNGRNLLLGGRRGHVAAFDWVTKKLQCEMNVMEEVVDVAWLESQSWFAIAQKKWVFIYDNQGTELHCIKRMNDVNRMEFLPHFFLLATANSTGYLSWLDVSIGELVGNYNTRLGYIKLMRNNPANGVLCIGGGKGVVSMWSPKVREPLAKLLCHSTPMSALTVDPKGMHMITGGLDRKVKVWDIRALNGPLSTYYLRIPANQIEVSQRGLLAFSQGNYIQMHKNLMFDKENTTPYLRHNSDTFVNCMRFCPYEDVLGVTTSLGFESLLVPGAGEPNFDAMEDNPFQTKSQRREHLVHSLLEKIPAEFISLDPNSIANIDVPTLQEKIDAKRSIFYLKPPQIDFKTRNKTKGRGGSVNAARNKQIVKDLKRKDFIEDLRKTKQDIIKQHKIENDNFIPIENEANKSVLSRFKPKKKRN